MTVRFLFCLLLFTSLLTTARAQTTVSGRVVDALDQSALLGANVVLLQLPDSVRRGAAVEPNGTFVVPGVPAGRYRLTVSFLGYQDLQRVVEVGSAPLNLGALTLQAGGVTLKGVEVVGQAAAAVQKGDTAQFNAGSFKTNPDASAGDLIRKMPGVTVDPTTGKVQAQGEQVQRVLVDGKEFFGNDPDAVLKNLPAEVIDKIQVYDRASDQSQFTGFDDGNQQKTINIITKPQFRNGKFGRVVAGYGPLDDRYRLSGNLNSFQGKRRLSVVAQSNNINEQNFGTDDLLGVIGSSAQGGGGRGGRGGGRGGQGGGGNNSGDFLVNQQGGISKTHAIGLNYSDTWGTKTTVQGSYFFNLSDNTSATSLLRRYVPTTDQPQDLRYAEDSRASSRNLNNRFNLRLDHKFDSLNSLLWRPSFSMQRNTGNSLLDGNTFVAAADAANATTPQGANASSYRSALTGITGSSQLLYRRRFARRGRTFAAGFNAGYNDNRGDNNLLSSTTFYRQQQPVTSTLNQFSELTQTGWNWRGSLDYTEPLGQHGAVQAEYDIAYTPNKSDKRTYDFVPGEQQYSLLNDTLSSVFQSNYLTNSGGLTYRYQNKDLQWSVGAELQNARLQSDQEFPRLAETRRSFLNLLPNAQVRYNFSKQQNLRLNYRTSTNAPSVGQLQEVVNNSNPLQLTTGNPNLRQETRQNLFVRYSSAVPEKSRSFFAFLGGSYVNNYITNNTIYASGAPLTVDGIVIPAGGQLTRPVNLSQQYSVRSFANYSQPLAFIKSNLSVNAGANYAQTPGLVFGELNYNRTPSANLGLALSSNISPEVDFTLSSNSSQNWVRNSLQQQLNSRYFRQNTSLRLSWIISKGITLKSDVNHQLYSGLAAGFNQNFVLWNASLGKKIFASQRGEIQVFAFDLLGQNNSIQRNIAAAYTEDVRTNILQRYFLLSFTYNIRSFGSGAGAAPEREGRDNNNDGPRPGGGRPGGGGFSGPGGGGM
ncbi:outer membrane beta-barrel protein [Hymenobacter psychrophilus]|uniref:Outer membrane receptor proteins, mostly Fe transport n=1 Tax=Hymenobacter psychrophilus TaxID=651662 RepID=A0A1H3FFC4_9BACT|nr:outer membrane beta-barrel protein [Hymenobacter psychrophilus]SDX89722.1 Outer membrane receptor proteins, mostly Fe transport [Hymenobacter psychrophilus]